MNEFKEEIKRIYKVLIIYKYVCVSVAAFMLLLGVTFLLAFPAYEQQQLLVQKEQRLLKRLETLENFAAGQVEREKKLSSSKRLYEQLRKQLPSKIEGYDYLAQLNGLSAKAGGILKGSSILKDNGRPLMVKIDKKDKTSVPLAALTIGISYYGSYEQILYFLELLEQNYLGSVENIRILNSKNGNLEMEGKLLIYALR